MKNQPVLERFLEKVDQGGPNGCWNFLSSIGKSGNGRFFYQGKCRDAYRVGYELMVGPIPEGKHLHHQCENRQCVNPEHLLPLSKKEHQRDYSPTHIAYINSRKTHCVKGHVLSEDNLVRYLRKLTGGRRCLTCARKRSRECQARLRSHD